MCAIAEEVSGGNLTITVAPESKNDMLGHAFERMIWKLKMLLGSLAASSETALVTSEELATACGQNGRAAANITRAIKDVASAATQSAQTSQQIAHSSDQQSQAAGSRYRGDGSAAEDDC